VTKNRSQKNIGSNCHKSGDCFVLYFTERKRRDYGGALRRTVAIRPLVIGAISVIFEPRCKRVPISFEPLFLEEPSANL